MGTLGLPALFGEWVQVLNGRVLVPAPQPGVPWTATIEHATMSLRITQPVDSATRGHLPFLEVQAMVRAPVAGPLGGVLGATFPGFAAG